MTIIAITVICVGENQISQWPIQAYSLTRCTFIFYLWPVYTIYIVLSVVKAWVRLFHMYRISSIRCHGCYLFYCSFCAATIRGQLLFVGGSCFFGKPGDSLTEPDSYTRLPWRHQRWYGRVRRLRLLDGVSSTRSLSVLVSALGTTRTTQTVLALAWWLSSEIICTQNRLSSLSLKWLRHLIKYS